MARGIASGAGMESPACASPISPVWRSDGVHFTPHSVAPGSAMSMTTRRSPAGFGPPPRTGAGRPPLSHQPRNLSFGSGMSVPPPESSVPETGVDDPSDDESPSQLPEIVCLCGDKCLTMKRGPHFSANEYARLAEVIVDGQVRCAIGVLTQGPDRLGVEDGAQDGFWKILEKYNNPNFFPLNSLGEIEPAVRGLIPGKGHTRDYEYLKKVWGEAKSAITKARENYGVSGQNNPDRSAFVSNLGLLYLWLRLEEAKLDSAVLKTLPDGVGREVGSGGPPSTAVKRPKRMKKVVNEKTPPATPQGAPGDLFNAAVAGFLGSLAQDAPKATETSAPPPMSRSVELALSVIKSNVGEGAKEYATKMLMEAMRKQAQDDDLIVIDD